jgi:hypothetical protein
MFGRARILFTIAACMVATSAAAQTPAAMTTAFDGKYVGTATLTGVAGACGTITSVDMTIKGGQVVVREIPFNGGPWTFRGTVNAAGEISTYLWTSWEGRLVNNLSGKIEDKVFIGRHLHGNRCAWTVHMGPLPAPTMPFDGDYAGVSKESSCLANGVPVTLIIRNGVVVMGGSWRGNVNPRGVVVMGNRLAPRVDGQIDKQGVLRAQGNSSDGGCTVTFEWRKQSG